MAESIFVPKATTATGVIQVIEVTGTTRTLADSDIGVLLSFTNAAGCAVTIPAGLITGFNCLMAQKGALQVVVSPSGFLKNFNNHTRTLGLNALIALAPSEVANEYFLTGASTA